MMKPCTLCSTPRDVLVRCQVDETQKWHFVCPGTCWKSVSGGVEDAKGLDAQYPHYRYGGMWKNRNADGPISAKKPRKVKERQKKEMKAREDGKSADEGQSEEVDATTSSARKSRSFKDRQREDMQARAEEQTASATESTEEDSA
ncbi:hypothetical protein E4T39_03575 [Aureobasidium subglaciale]|nr:hypothetical protein E4T39_03575 [Aureobasidium subglaciale]